MSIRSNIEHVLDRVPAGEQTFLVPYRYGDAGWFDWMPMAALYPVYLWHLSMRDDDWERVEALRRAEAFDWCEVDAMRDKHDSGHEAPWARFLAGDNPDYPERILHASRQQLCRRVAQLGADTSAGTRHHVHHWQWGNPVTSEALVQLTLGAPQPIYNGGLLHARLRYWDADRRRAGLPEDVGALVERLASDRTVVCLVNLSPVEARTVIVQAGAFGEHRFTSAAWAARTSDWPGDLGGYAGTYRAPQVTTEPRRIEVDGQRLTVELPPATEIRLDLGTERYVATPSMAAPW